MALEEGDIVLCTVEKIAGTMVFVDIEGDDRQGSIILSEIAPGRIRNLRNYVVPKKKIVCKVLKVANTGVHLSLRRVSKKEREEMLNLHKIEKSYIKVIKNLIDKEKGEKAIEEIKKKDHIYNFIEKAKEDLSKLEDIVGKKDAKKIIETIKKQKTKKREAKKEIKLDSKEPNGLEIIKKLLGDAEGIEVNYVSAGRYSLKTEGEDVKKADKKIKKFLDKVEDKAKKKGANYELVKK